MRLLTAAVCEITYFIELLLKLLVAVAHDWEAEVRRVSLIASIGPLALGC